jgi:hypothetical protein
MRFELYRTPNQILALTEKLPPISRGDATLLPKYFLASLESRFEPRVVACFEEEALIGVLYCAEVRFWGVRTGFISGGDSMGRGLLLAPPEREQEIFIAAVSFLVDNGTHGMRLLWTPQNALRPNVLAELLPSARVQQTLEVHAEGDWLRLQPTYEAFLAHLGPHTRRNLRYYRRKVQAAGYAYTGILRAEQLFPTLQSLNQLADYPMDKARLVRDRRFFAAFGTPVVAGLRDAQGQFISLVTGFTEGSHLHILTQLNGESEALRKLSISLVLRGYLIEEFIARGITAVHFVHGSSPMLGRFCEPVPLQRVAIDARHAWMTPLKRFCSSLAEFFRRNGVRVPYRLQRCAGSYLQ